MKLNRFLTIAVLPILCAASLASCSGNKFRNDIVIDEITRPYMEDKSLAIDYDLIKMDEGSLYIPLLFKYVTGKTVETSKIKIVNTADDTSGPFVVDEVSLDTSSSKPTYLKISGGGLVGNSVLEARKLIKDYSIVIHKDATDLEEDKKLPLSFFLPRLRVNVTEVKREGANLIVDLYLHLGYAKINGLRLSDFVFSGDLANAEALSCKDNILKIRIPESDTNLETIEGTVGIKDGLVNTLWGESYPDLKTTVYQHYANSLGAIKEKIIQVLVGACGSLLGGLTAWGLEQGFDQLFKTPTEKALDELQESVDEISDSIDDMNSNMESFASEMEMGLSNIQSAIDTEVLNQVEEYSLLIDLFEGNSFAKRILDSSLIDDSATREAEYRVIYDEMQYMNIEEAYIEQIYLLGGFIINTKMSTGESILSIYDEAICSTYNWEDIDVVNVEELWRDDLLGKYAIGYLNATFYYYCDRDFGGHMRQESIDDLNQQVSDVSEKEEEYPVTDMSEGLLKYDDKLYCKHYYNFVLKQYYPYVLMAELDMFGGSTYVKPYMSTSFNTQVNFSSKYSWCPRDTDGSARIDWKCPMDTFPTVAQFDEMQKRAVRTRGVDFLHEMYDYNIIDADGDYSEIEADYFDVYVVASDGDTWKYRDGELGEGCDAFDVQFLNVTGKAFRYFDLIGSNFNCNYLSESLPFADYQIFDGPNSDEYYQDYRSSYVGLFPILNINECLGVEY